MIAQHWWLTRRRLSALLKQPAFVAISLVQPAIWLLLFGALFRRVIELPGFGTASYLDYLVPGVVVMNAVSANMWAGMGAIEEIDRGTLDRFLVAPVSRAAIVDARIAEQAVTTVLQSAIIVLLGWAAGAHYAGGVAGALVLVAASVLLGLVFAALSTLLGMTVRQRESIIGMSVFLLLPLTFLSPAFMARDLMPGWIRGISAANPLTWAIEAGRGALGGHADWAAVGWRGLWLGGLAAVALWLSAGSFRSYQKSL